jgi:uncharacterized protein YndB with AHSA1/START domain
MLAASLKISARTEREIVITRLFDAPREVVFDAFTQPELLRRWLGVFGDWGFEVCDVDLRPGGAYRWVWRNAADGSALAVSGVVREVQRPERLVMTERYEEPWYPGEAVNTATFVTVNGQTLYTATLRYESREARDTVLRSPMETGLAQGYAALDAMLTSGAL